jgi:serine O-acetyltransferase
MGFDRRLRPEIGDNVVLGAGCKILGGIRVGDHVTVGANSVVVNSVEAGSTVVGIPARQILKKQRRNHSDQKKDGGNDNDHRNDNIEIATPR